MSLSKGYMLPKVEKVVLQEKVDLYARASGDCNPIHIDADFANQSQFGGRIAHGMMIAATLSEMVTMVFEKDWVDTGSLKIRFRAPVYPGESISTFGEVEKVTEMDQEKYAVMCSVGIRRDNGELVISGSAEVTVSKESRIFE